MFLEALSCLNPERLDFVPAGDLRQETIAGDPYQRILSDEFGLRLDRSMGTIQILIHPYFGEHYPQQRLQPIPQAYYQYKRSQLLAGLGPQMLPTITLLAENEIVPRSVYSQLSAETVIIPTLSSHSVPDIDGSIRQVDSAVNTSLRQLLAADHNLLTNQVMEYVRNSSVHEYYRMKDAEYLALSRERDQLVENSWNQFSSTLRLAGVKKAILRGKVLYRSKDGRNATGCITEVSDHLRLHQIRSVGSTVMYVHEVD